MLFFIFPVVIILLGIGIAFAKNRFFTPQKTHLHAGFIIFQNNKQINFSEAKYMFLEPCTANKSDNDTAEDIQIEKAHLHDNVGDLVHIERTGATWKDLFTNIHYPIDYTKAKAYINGVQVKNFQNQQIHNDDSLVVFLGKDNPTLLSQSVTKNYIETMAKKSTTCGE